ncbi:hypothetical protein [Pseudoduganella sp. GCM10020061]|uniref:hypothetical protein n=1 Tax=Pseudoduganella sp. GCM10020061 TaxID=3317345 RepID=UPI003635911A
MLKQASLIAAAAAGLLCTATPSFAQDYRQVPQASSMQSSEVITVRPTKRSFFMPAQDVAEVRGEYLMEDGSTAMVKNRSRKLIVDFDNRQTVLHAVGAYVFESDRDDMTLVYTKDGLGADIIVLSYIPQRTVAGGPRERILLSSR